MKIRVDLDDDFYARGFDAETDIYSKRELASRLTRLYANLDHGTVSILDGRWGVGKTVFARQWKQELSQNGIACIYFDAFAADYVESPFRAVAAAFVRAAKSARANDEKTYAKFLSATAKAAKAIAAPSAKMAVKAVTLGLVGSAEIAEFKDVAEAAASGLGDISEEAVKSLLEEQVEDEAHFEALRTSLAALPKLLSKTLNDSAGDEVKTEKKCDTLVVIIDELDRCRPDFALGVLEVLKHFFRADHVHFVLVTNLEHLHLSVRKRYGVGRAAGEYIQKFYDFIIPFESPQGFSSLTVAGAYTRRLLEAMLHGAETNDGRYLIDEVAEMVSAYNLTLRQAQRVSANVVLAQIDFQKRIYRPGILIALMAIIKALEPRLFSDIKMKKIDSDRVVNFVKKAKWQSDYKSERLISLIIYHTDSSITENDEAYKGYSGELFHYNFSSRLDILPYIANSIIDSFG